MEVPSVIVQGEVVNYLIKNEMKDGKEISKPQAPVAKKSD